MGRDVIQVVIRDVIQGVIVVVIQGVTVVVKKRQLPNQLLNVSNLLARHLVTVEMEKRVSKKLFPNLMPPFKWACCTKMWKLNDSRILMVSTIIPIWRIV